MTVTTDLRLPSIRRPITRTALAAGMALALCAGVASSAAPAPAGQSMAVGANDPAKQLPGGLQVTAVDFRRGEGGSGKLVLRFNGDGAAPDLRNSGSDVVVDLGNVQLPAHLQRPMNVTDFATPVQRIDARSTSSGSRLVLGTQGAYESMAYQSGNEYIVEIVPRAPTPMARTGAVVPAMGAASPASSSATPTVRYSGKPVTFNFQDVPVRTVLQLIAEESNLNIVASDAVTGNVTLRLMNVPWDQALDIVLQAKQLDKRRSGSVIWVAPQKEIADFEQAKEDARINIENRAEMVTEYIPINYGNAEDIAKLLTEESKGNQSSGQGGQGGGGGLGNLQASRGFLSPRGSISFDRRTNTLLVIDIPKRVSDIRDLVRRLDKPVDQVVIEARVVIATESVARSLGARFGISGANGSNKAFSGNLNTNTENLQSIYDTNRANDAALAAYETAVRKYQADLDLWQQTYDPAKPTLQPQAPTRPQLSGNTITRGLMNDLAAGIVGSLNKPGALALSILNAGHLLDIELSALQEQGRGEVIANPRVVTSNQKEAVIKQGREIGYLTVSGGGASNVPKVEFKEAVLELKVTPTITNDGRVFMAMEVKKDELESFVNVGNFGEVPMIAKRLVNTSVLVEDGQTVVIGGVYEFRNRQDVAKVPFLADLPILGHLFRKNGTSKEKAELLIFVTPKVMQVQQRM